jgi:hypothetical protein
MGGGGVVPVVEVVEVVPVVEVAEVVLVGLVLLGVELPGEPVSVGAGNVLVLDVVVFVVGLPPTFERPVCVFAVVLSWEVIVFGTRLLVVG